MTLLFASASASMVGAAAAVEVEVEVEVEREVERESVCVCVRAKETVCFLFWGFFSFEGLATLLMYPGLRACLLFPFLAALSSWIARPCREDGGAPAARCGEGQRR